MKKNNLISYILIGLGTFFLLKELKIPILTDFYSWPTLLILLGAAFFIHAYSAKEYKNIFPAVILLGLGVHFHGIAHYSFWIDHWGVYTFIVGLAFFLRFLKTKQGIVPSIILIGISIFAIFVDNQPSWFVWIYDIMNWIERFWPLLLIGIGVYLLLRKK
ncbi:LiaI-LiaF-like domain-containing protein [Gracilibacillus marinus]|jgi:hypothetical protein|uniref:LiaI-LiaF-like domain-containing protein n=1 Tax=Gracilibacillus marinus TaxID=630535 RepID=A0ABV8VWS8_9BACI